MGILSLVAVSFLIGGHIYVRASVQQRKVQIREWEREGGGGIEMGDLQGVHRILFYPPHKIKILSTLFCVLYPFWNHAVIRILGQG